MPGRRTVDSTAGRPALRAGRDDPGGQPAGGQQERGVAHHPMLRPDRQPDHVPRPDQAFPCLRLGEAPLRRAGPRRAGTAAWSSRRSRPARRPAPARRPPFAAPTRARACPARCGPPVQRRRREYDISDSQGQLVAGVAEKAAHVALGVLGVVGPHLVGHHRPCRPDGLQQRTGQRPRTRRPPPAPGRPGRCRPTSGSARRPWGRSPAPRAAWTARSRPAAGAAPGTGVPTGETTRLPSGLADQVVVGQSAAVGVILPARLQDQRVVAALGVGELHPVPGPERAAAAGPGAGRRGLGHTAVVRRRRRGGGISRESRALDDEQPLAVGPPHELVEGRAHRPARRSS